MKMKELDGILTALERKENTFIMMGMKELNDFLATLDRLREVAKDISLLRCPCCGLVYIMRESQLSTRNADDGPLFCVVCRESPGSMLELIIPPK